MGTVTRKLGTSNFSPQVQLFGEWDKALMLSMNLDQAVLTGYTMAQSSAAKKIKKIVRRKIRQNGGSTYWPPVSQRYAEYKEQLGFDPGNLLSMTGLYYNNIKVWSIRNTTYIGLKAQTRNYFTGGRITLREIAVILEHGSYVRRIEARPLWRPSWKEFGGKTRLRGLILWHIRAQIQTRFGVRAKITF